MRVIYLHKKLLHILRQEIIMSIDKTTLNIHQAFLHVVPFKILKNNHFKELVRQNVF